MIGAICETLGVSVIVPFADVLLSPEESLKKEGYTILVEWFQLQSGTELIVFLAVVVALIYVIKKLAQQRLWNWIITLHPKINDVELIEEYRNLARENTNVTFNDGPVDIQLLRKADVMLCDSSSIIVEFMLLDKPVVTFRNTNPGDYLLNVLNEEEVEGALEEALSRPEHLMEHIHNYTMHHEPHRDGKNSERVLEAVDDFITNYKGKLKPKPLNLWRKFKIRIKARYFRFS